MSLTPRGKNQRNNRFTAEEVKGDDIQLSVFKLGGSEEKNLIQIDGEGPGHHRGISTFSKAEDKTADELLDRMAKKPEIGFDDV